MKAKKWQILLVVAFAWVVWVSKGVTYAPIEGFENRKDCVEWRDNFINSRIKNEKNASPYLSFAGLVGVKMKDGTLFYMCFPSAFDPRPKN